MKTKNNYPALVTIRHKKARALRCLIFNLRHRQTPRWKIIEQQPAPIRLYFQFLCTDTYTMICTNYKKPHIKFVHSASIYLSIIPSNLKILPIFRLGIIFTKCLSIFSFDSLRRIPIRCGIDAKVRSKNEIARKK